VSQFPSPTRFAIPVLRFVFPVYEQTVVLRSKTSAIYSPRRVSLSLSRIARIERIARVEDDEPEGREEESYDDVVGIHDSIQACRCPELETMNMRLFIIEKARVEERSSVFRLFGSVLINAQLVVAPILLPYALHPPSD